MRRLTLICCAALLVGCTPADEQAAADTYAAAPATLSLADVAGTWTMDAKNAAGDSTLVQYQMVATNTMDGWTVTFPNRQPQPARVVAVAGDSVVVDIGPYESMFRPGVMVSTRSVSRLVDGKMVGTFRARYETTAADSVLWGTHEGMRVAQ
ncbi:MAG: hypothetical protein OEO20_10700 [Gemmatimonadota bacterium]|nr:hypothetical protein [Gemmatimonadota bacterium]MDH3368847.1 hypothetical protein [Gemmatimonadota bacterium]MDH3478762.1 hypothetical protein [Gemmatimonadota bacterium]MDH3569369.1 hypothetical protein [Gemmatimonadota bacterium]MDH5551287.1 hypothetical protein [Gemmatimonadota bacterium]